KQPEHGVREIAERVVAVDALRRTSVTRQIRDDDAEMPRQNRNVALEVRRSGGARSAAMQHQQRRSLARFGDMDIAASDAQCPFQHRVRCRCFLEHPVPSPASEAILTYSSV